MEPIDMRLEKDHGENKKYPSDVLIKELDKCYRCMIFYLSDNRDEMDRVDNELIRTAVRQFVCNVDTALTIISSN